MAIKAVTMEESRNPQSANIFSRTQNLRTAISEIEEAMYNLFARVSTPPSSNFIFGRAKKNALYGHPQRFSSKKSRDGSVS